MAKDYSSYVKQLGQLYAESEVLSASILSDIANNCYIVSSYDLLPTDKLAIGDVGIVSSLIVEGMDELSSRTAYYWTGDTWAALNGNYNVSNVYFERNIEMTQQFGHHEVPLCGHYTLETKGKSILSVLEEAYQVAEHANTSPPRFSLLVNNSTTTSYTSEVGNSYTLQAAKLKLDSIGTYQYGTIKNPTSTSENTGISIAVNNAKIVPPVGISEISNSIVLSAAGNSFSSNTGTTTYYYTDETSSFAYSASAEWQQGDIPLNNIGVEDEGNRIPSGISSLSRTIAYTGHRYGFYGYRMKGESFLDFDNLSSNDIRLSIHASGSNKWDATAGNWPSKFTVPTDSTQIIFAVPSTAKNLDSHKYIKMNEPSMGDYQFKWDDGTPEGNTTGLIRAANLSVDGAKAGTPIEYKIWTIDSRVPFKAEKTYNITYSSSQLQ